MLLSFKHILKTKLQALDGKVGYLDDLLFDDQKWIIRYLVVLTGGILNRQRVLVSPLGIAHMDWNSQTLTLSLTQKQVAESPDVETDPPVFRQMEKRYFDYNNWPYYWDEMNSWGIDSQNPFISIAQGAIERANQSSETSPPGDPHLESCRVVRGYSVDVEKSRRGHIEDFLIEDENWAVKKIVIDSNLLWEEHPVVVSPQLVSSIDWAERCVRLTVTEKDFDKIPASEPENFLGPQL